MAPGDLAADGYVRRVVDEELDELVASLPAIVIEGPKGVGKTATALQRARTVYALDDPGVRELVRSDPQRLVRGEVPILIDEWQRFPPSWDVVRRAVDRDASAGRFLLAGSASPSDPGTHSGAARMVRLRMRPLSLAERGVAAPTVSLAELLTGERLKVEGHTDVALADYAQQVCGSGFPGLRGLPPRALRAQLDGYLTAVGDRDFAELGHDVRSPAALRRWLAAYAAASSTVAAYETIRDAATPGQGSKPAKTTTSRYHDILERLWVADPVPAWLPTRNHLRRLAAAPKHQLADPALAVRLLGASVDALVSTEPSPAVRDSLLIGQLFESLVTLDVRVYAQAAEAEVAHLRTRGGEQEIDLIVQRHDHRVVAIEVKLTAVPDDDDVRHLRWLAHRIGNDLLDMVIITTGDEAYRRDDGIAVVPAALLGP